MDAGFVHCDPHEGNMRLGKYVEFTFVGFGDSLGLSFRDSPRMLLDDGRLGLIDFGLVAQMTAVHQALGTSSHGGPPYQSAGEHGFRNTQPFGGRLPSTGAETSSLSSLSRVFFAS